MNSQLARLEQQFQEFFGPFSLIPKPDALPELSAEELAEGDATEERR